MVDKCRAKDPVYCRVHGWRTRLTKEQQQQVDQNVHKHQTLFALSRTQVSSLQETFKLPEPFTQQLKQQLTAISNEAETYAHDYTVNVSPELRAGEEEFLKGYDPFKYGKVPVGGTCDTLIFTIQNGELCMLMIKRGGHPFRGFWANPGGFIDRGEHPAQAAVREVVEETSYQLTPEQIIPAGLYSHPDRDPRMRIVTHSYVTVIPELAGKFSAADDADDARLVPVLELFNKDTPVAFDHLQIISDGLKLLNRLS